MAYREPLPPDCPPGDAAAVAAARTFYRMVWNDPPADSDFRSYRDLEPDEDFGDDECRARGLSLYANRRAVERLQAGERWRGALICQVTILPNAGPIKKTRRHHYTWWPLAGFAILQHSRIG